MYTQVSYQRKKGMGGNGHLRERRDAPLRSVGLDIHVPDCAARLQHPLETARRAHEAAGHEKSVHLRRIRRVVHRLCSITVSKARSMFIKYFEYGAGNLLLLGVAEADKSRPCATGERVRHAM